MKIDRLIGILSVLLQQEKITAPKLAERFEVSRRTIIRDVESLCLAGIPIRTEQGVNGGISIMEDYKIDKTLLTKGEMQSILAGLKNLDSISGGNRYQKLMEKLSLGSSDLLLSNDHVLIDLSSWKTSLLGPRINCIQAAVENCQKIKFQYFTPSGSRGTQGNEKREKPHFDAAVTPDHSSERELEPYLLVFRWQAWYVWGFCSRRQEFRLFKLSRMEHLQVTEEKYESRRVPQLSEIPTCIHNPDSLKVTAVFSGEMKWRLLEEFGGDHIREMEDGRLFLEFTWSDKESLYSYLLGYREHAELLTPIECREELLAVTRRIENNYLKHDI